jgi:Smg protein
MDERINVPTTFRVMGPHEKGRFAPDAWGHLLSLSGSGAISGAELEHIIERALVQFDGRIALDDLRGLLEGTGLEESAPGADGATVH